MNQDELGKLAFKLLCRLTHYTLAESYSEHEPDVTIVANVMGRIAQLEEHFRHRHVNNGIDDDCKICRLDLRDEVHERLNQ